MFTRFSDEDDRNKPFWSKPMNFVFASIATCLLVMVTGYDGVAQQAASSPDQTAEQTEAAPEEDIFSPEQIAQLVAPIALHPDALVAQILMASTYPLEVVQAARWAEENPDVEAEALEEAMQDQPWDASVKSLTAFPQVLQMMSDELTWTQQLGDAFLAQEEDVLATIQLLRAQADEAGNLETTNEQTVAKETVAVDGGKSETVYVIQPADPKVVYVPAYDPTVVYGSWRYPAYAPYYWYPRGYVAGRLFWWGTGYIIGRALWGNFDWRRRSVNININIYNRYNRTKITNPKWTHRPEHRRAPYRGKEVATRYGKVSPNVKSREQFRGRVETGRRELPSARPSQPSASLRPGGPERPSAPTARPRPEKPSAPVARPRPEKPAAPAARPKPTQPSAPAARPQPGKPAAKPAPRPTQPAAKPAPRPTKPAAKPAPRPSKPAAKPAPRPTKKAARPAPRPAPAFQGVGSGKQVKKQSARGKASRKKKVRG